MTCTGFRPSYLTGCGRPAYIRFGAEFDPLGTDVEHNHKTYDINELKQPGECPACDVRWEKETNPVTTVCPFCRVKVRVTIVILMTWMCPHCHKKWVQE